MPNLPQSPLLDINNRIATVERKLDSLNDHLQLIDSNVIDKHKAAMERVKEMEQSVSSMKSDVSDASKLILRMEKRLEAFATKDQVDVLDKYVSFFHPLKFVTEEEVKRLISDVLQEKSESKSSKVKKES